MALKRLVQISCLVENLERARKIMTEEFGFSIWWGTEGMPPFDDYTINGEPAAYDNKIAFCEAFGLEWEFIEPKSGPLLAWIQEHGPGIHHLAFLQEESFQEFDAKVKRIMRKDTWLRGQSKTLGMDYSFYDLTKEVGMFFEIYNNDQPHPLGFNMDARPDPPID